MSPAKQALTNRRLEKADKVFSHLSADVVAELLSTAADLVLLLDAKGVIVDLAVGEEDLLSKGCQKWRGKPWVQTVTVESQPKVQALLGEVDSATGAAWRHINHPMADGVDLPLAYSLVTLPSTGGPAHSVPSQCSSLTAGSTRSRKSIRPHKLCSVTKPAVPV
jgi:hypothetical protein